MSDQEEDIDPSYILKFYQKQQEQSEKDFKRLEDHVKNVKISQSEIKQLQWKLQEKEDELKRLRENYEEVQESLLEERQNHLQVVAMNDRLKIKLQKKNRQIEHLISKTNDNISNYQDTPSTSRTNRKRYRISQNQRATSNEYEDTVASDLDEQAKDILIENETLNLTVETMRIQLEEQKMNFDEILASLKTEIESIKTNERAKNIELRHQLEENTTRMYNIQTLYRENIKEMLGMRKSIMENQRMMNEDHLILRSKIIDLSTQLNEKKKVIKNLEETRNSTFEYKDQSDIQDLELRLQLSRDELAIVQNENALSEANLKQNISRLELLNEKISKEITASKKDNIFYLDSIFSECVELKKSIVDILQSLKSQSNVQNSNQNTPRFISRFRDETTSDIPSKVEEIIDNVDELMLFVQRCKTKHSGAKTPTKNRVSTMRSVFDVVSKSHTKS
ncbi:hypothetical protein BB559_005323 [Furculomyces boomerangus]|uniref:Uncharacterized protein n=1 Tax=Furculomyces boomerangus TaxID=61424 RepID=A0A2T9Y9F7_9FUNG|nr:hypothetical protein BB559_005323 [Furculomyces boomerangus]